MQEGQQAGGAEGRQGVGMGEVEGAGRGRKGAGAWWGSNV